MEQAKKLTRDAQVKGTTGVKPMRFVEDLKSEFHKISWTSREELMAYTKIVIAATFLTGFAVYGADLMIRSLLDLLSVVA